MFHVIRYSVACIVLKPKRKSEVSYCHESVARRKLEPKVPTCHTAQRRAIIVCLMLTVAWSKVQPKQLTGEPLLSSKGLNTPEKQCTTKGARRLTTSQITRMSSYVYTALPSPEHFRLLQLALEHGRLSASLSSYSLDTCPEYIALSYTWGSVRSTASLQISGSLLSIGEHRSHALIQLADRCGLHKPKR